MNMVYCMNIDKKENCEFLWVYCLTKENYDNLTENGSSFLIIKKEEYERIEHANSDYYSGTIQEASQVVVTTTKKILERNGMLHIYDGRNINNIFE